MDETEVVHGIRVRYWAAAKSASGVAEDVLACDSPLTLAEIRARVVALHPGTRLGQILAACSTLVGDRPVGTADPAEVVVQPGDHVEFLPPFAGG